MDLLFHFLSSGGRLSLPVSKSFRNTFLHHNQVLMNRIQYAETAAPSLFFTSSSSFVFFFLCRCLIFPLILFSTQTHLTCSSTFFLLLQSLVQVYVPGESCSIKEAKVQKMMKNKEFKGQLASHQRRTSNQEEMN